MQILSNQEMKLKIWDAKWKRNIIILFQAGISQSTLAFLFQWKEKQSTKLINDCARFNFYKSSDILVVKNIQKDWLWAGRW